MVIVGSTVTGHPRPPAESHPRLGTSASVSTREDPSHHVRCATGDHGCPAGDDLSARASVMNGAGDTSTSAPPAYQPVAPPGIIRATRPPPAVTVNRRPATSADADASTIRSFTPPRHTAYAHVTPGAIP